MCGEVMQEDGNPETLTTAAMALGYAGLLPQVIAAILVWQGGVYQTTALAGGFGYAMLIFSFLGGVWWGQAIAAAASGQRAEAGVYCIAVLPSLIGLALLLTVRLGVMELPIAMYVLGISIAASPLIDRALGYADRGLMRLRWHLSLGLGILTAAIGFFAQNAV